MASDRRVPSAPQIRHRVDPAYIPADKVARRLHLTPAQFHECERRLSARGFPLPDETTSMYDLETIDRWRKLQRPDLCPELTAGAAPIAIERPRTDWGTVFVDIEKRERAGGRKRR